MKNNLNRALSFCSKNIRSKSEVIKKINTWKLGQDEIENLIAFLDLHKFFYSDEEYIDKFLENLSSQKGYSKIQLKMKLAKKGLPVKLVTEKLDNYYKVAEDLEINKFIKKNMRKIISKPREASVKYLISRGFRYTLIVKHFKDLNL